MSLDALIQITELGNDREGKNPGQGAWGSITSYETSDYKRFLQRRCGAAFEKVPQFKSNSGDAPDGSIMASRSSQRREG